MVGDAFQAKLLTTDAKPEVVPQSLPAYADWALDTQVGNGKFQLVYMVLLGFAYGLPSAHTYANMFASMKPDHLLSPFGWHESCDASSAGCVPALELKEPANCSGVPLQQWAPDQSGRSIVADFKLICDRDYRLPLLGSLYFAGFGLGLLVCGQISDQFGRKAGYLFSISVVTVGGFLASLAPCWSVYAVARAMLGFGVAGAGNTTFVWMSELLNPDLRPVMAWVPNVLFCVGQALLSAIAAGIESWRCMLLVLTLITATGLLYAPCMSESPRWLASKGEGVLVHKVVCQMAASNGRPEPPPFWCASGRLGTDPESMKQARQKVAATAPSAGILSLLRNPVLGPRFLCMCLSWFSIAFTFYGLGLFSPNLPFNAYAANAINAAVAVPFYLAGQPLIDAPWCGRKGVVVGGFLLGGVGLLASAFVRSVALSMMVFYAANGALSLAFGIIYVWSSEMFPTNIRGRVMAYMSIAGRLGAILAPFVVDIGATRPSLALAIFAAPCAASGLLDMFLPETRGKQLPHTLEDAITL